MYEGNFFSAIWTINNKSLTYLVNTILHIFFLNLSQKLYIADQFNGYNFFTNM